MKKFSKINKKKIKNNAFESDNINDLIKNLINEALTIKDGVIIGKEQLTDTLIKMINIKESKTIIKTLESVKIKSYNHLNLNWINENIDIQKDILNGKITENINEELDATLIAKKKEVEETINESKTDKSCNDCKDDDEKDKKHLKPKNDEEEETDLEEDEEETEVNEASKELWTKVNWMDREEIKNYLEDAGFAVYDNEDLEELKSILVNAVEDGDIILSDINESFVKKEKFVNDNDKQFINNLNDIYNNIIKENNEEDVKNDKIDNFKIFKNRYGVIKNHITNESIIFNYFGNELEFVENKIVENKVSSIIKDGNKKMLVNGFETKNILGYIITNEPINEKFKFDLKR